MWAVYALEMQIVQVLTICVLIGEPVYKLVNPEFKVSLHQLWQWDPEFRVSLHQLWQWDPESIPLDAFCNLIVRWGGKGGGAVPTRTRRW